MTITISLVNQKGGVGKSTLSVCIAYKSAKVGKKTLVVDADPSGSIMSWLAHRQKALPDNFAVIAMPTITLSRDLPVRAKGYDVVIIDSPPRTTDIAKSVVFASDIVIVPCAPSPYDIWASEGAFTMIKEAMIYKPNLKFFLMINMKKGNSVIGRDIQEAIVEIEEKINLKIPVLNAKVSHRIVFAETAAIGLTVQEADKEMYASKEIQILDMEIMGNA